MNIASGRTMLADTSFPLEVGETVTINASYSPGPASVDFGLVDDDGIFHSVNVTDGNIDYTIQITERGNYTFAVRNNSSTTIAVSGSAGSAAAQNRAYAAAVEAEQNAAQRAGITMEQVDALIDMGYISEEIEAMTPAQVDSILTKDLTPAEKEAYYRAKASMTPFSVTAEAPAGYTAVEAEQNAAQRAGITMEQMDSILTKDLTPAEKEAYYRAKASMTPFSVTAEAPAGYTYVAAVPDGGSDEWFHPDVDTTERTINSVISGAKSIAQTIFNTTASYSTIRYSYYYLCGEWGEDAGRENWCHEGIDMKHATNATAAVYSPISGYVSKSSTSGKYVNIYNASLGITVNIQHLNNLDGTLVEGSYVKAGQFLGNQNTSDGHVHLQVCTHTECASVHSGRDLDLICTRPDRYI